MHGSIDFTDFLYLYPPLNPQGLVVVKLYNSKEPFEIAKTL